LEVVIGAILTQNTGWKNVECAIDALKEAGCLSWHQLHDLTEENLANLIRSSGTYRVKAARIKAFVDALFRDHGGNLEAMLGGDLETARKRLLAIAGIGPETADAILLYAGGRLTFVVDTYTRRVLRRHFLATPKDDYESIRQLFHKEAEPHEQIYNEYHALLVELGKRHCRPRAACDECPLRDLPHDPSL
jgi:endonuclease-3 related protein